MYRGSKERLLKSRYEMRANTTTPPIPVLEVVALASSIQIQPPGDNRIEFLAKGVKGLAEGAKLNLLAAALAVIGSIAVAVAAYAALQGFGSMGHVAQHPTRHTGVAAGMGVVSLILLVILASFALAFMGWLRFREGAEALAACKPEYRVGLTGVKLVLAGVAVGILSVIADFALLPAGGWAVALLGVSIAMLVMLVGYILFSIMLFRLGEVDTGYKTAGILLILGIVLSLVRPLAFIGAIIELIGFYTIYSTSKRVSERLSVETSMGVPPSGNTGV